MKNSQALQGTEKEHFYMFFYFDEKEGNYGDKRI